MSAKRYFVGVIEKDEDSAFGVWFPDAPGAYGAADEFEDVISAAGQALRHHVEALQTAGMPTPEPRAYDEVINSADVRSAIAAGAAAIVVPLLADGGRTVRVNVSIERDLVEQIDSAAEARGLTRSAFLAQAARDKILAGVV